MAKRVTIEDLAREVGVSKSTVSCYLNHRKESLSANTIARLDEAVEKLGYVRNTNYKKRKKTFQLGLLVSDITDPFLSMLCKGVNDACLECGYRLLIANTDNVRSREKAYIQDFLGSVDGLIINSCGMDDETVALLHSSVPVVLVDRNWPELGFDVITANNAGAMTGMMEHLYSMGYNAFGLFTEPLVEGTPRTVRTQAFREFAKRYVGHGEFIVNECALRDDKQLMYQVMTFFEETVGKKRVLIGINGRTLLQVISALSILNYRVPEDVGVCGYDDFDWAQVVKGGVTTLQQPTYEMGHQCVRRILQRIENKNLPVEEIFLQSRLVDRSSLR